MPQYPTWDGVVGKQGQRGLPHHEADLLDLDSQPLDVIVSNNQVGGDCASLQSTKVDLVLSIAY